MLYKAVIFDLDGTLLDTLADIANCMNSVLQKHNLPVRPTENYKSYVGEGMAKLVENVLENNPVSGQMKAVLLKEMQETYALNWMQETKSYHGINEAFSALSIYGKDLKLGVLSNKPDAFTKEMVKFYFPDVPFSQVRGAINSVPKKPNPQAVLEMAEVWRISTEEIVFMGDSNIDMQTAKNANCFAAGALWGFRMAKELQENGADILLGKPQDLLKILA